MLTEDTRGIMRHLAPGVAWGSDEPKIRDASAMLVHVLIDPEELRREVTNATHFSKGMKRLQCVLC